jgi:hypothetical protein
MFYWLCSALQTAAQLRDVILGCHDQSSGPFSTLNIPSTKPQLCERPGAAGRARGGLLQPARHLRAVIKEGKGAVKWTRLSCRTFVANAVRLQLHVLAYNLGNFMRTLAMPKPAEPWSLTSPREKLVKIARRSSATAATQPFRWPRSVRHDGARRRFGNVESLLSSLAAQ